MRFTSKLAHIALGLLLAPGSRAANLTPKTLQAWNHYVQESENELAQQSAVPDHFLWIERREGGLETVQFRNNLSVYSPRGGGIPVPSGLVHHWIGTVFIPKARVPDLLKVVQDYDSYAAVYSPGVVESKLLMDDHHEFAYRLKFEQKGFGVKAGLLADFKATYYQLTPEVGYAVTEATALTELVNVATPREHPLSFADSHGYIEKVFTVMRYRQVDGGIYVEVETLTLSRDVPAAIRWLVSPAIERFSRQTVADTLAKLSNRVQNTRSLETAENAGPLTPAAE